MASLPPFPIPFPLGTASNDTSPSNPPKPDSPPSSSHLSHAIIAGIAVGCVLATSFLVMISCLLIYSKRRGSAHAEPWSKGELPADDVDNETRDLGPHMVDSKAMQE